MDRRTFVAGSLGIAATSALAGSARAAHGASATSSPAATDLSALALTLTDTGFEIAQPLKAGRYEVTVANTGTIAESHFGLGKVPDRVTDAEYEEWLQSEEGTTAALSIEDIAFVGVPDWPPPGGSVTGVVGLAPGRHFLFDPFSFFTGREALTFQVDGELVDTAEPAADVTVELREMAIELPETAFTSEPMRWKIENVGAMSHEVAVLSVSSDFTAEHLELLAGLPLDATPPPDVPELVYQPVAAIGILAGQHTSWLDVQLEPGRYLAVCMLPFTTGYPHAVDGMYLFFDVE